jgi:putative FmdB family regulatory protein
MPIYEYRCQSCDKEMEALVRSGKEPEECPACKGPLVRKISRAGIIFKGSGFYVNDSRGSNGGGKSNKGSNGSSTPAEGAGKDSGGKDSGGSADSKAPAGDSASSAGSASSSKSETSSKAAE